MGCHHWNAASEELQQLFHSAGLIPGRSFLDRFRSKNPKQNSSIEEKVCERDLGYEPETFILYPLGLSLSPWSIQERLENHPGVLQRNRPVSCRQVQTRMIAAS